MGPARSLTFVAGARATWRRPGPQVRGEQARQQVGDSVGGSSGPCLGWVGGEQWSPGDSVAHVSRLGQRGRARWPVLGRRPVPATPLLWVRPFAEHPGAGRGPAVRGECDGQGSTDAVTVAVTATLAAKMRVGGLLPTAPNPALFPLLRKRELLGEGSEVVTRRHPCRKGVEAQPLTRGPDPRAGEQAARSAAPAWAKAAGASPPPLRAPRCGRADRSWPEGGDPRSRGLGLPASRRRAVIGGPRASGGASAARAAAPHRGRAGRTGRPGSGGCGEEAGGSRGET